MVCDVSFNSVVRLLNLAGIACKEHHNKHVRGIEGRRNIQCDELWSYVYCKEKRKRWAIPLDAAGSVWTFTALDAKSKLLVSYKVRIRRDTRSATVLMRDLGRRLAKNPKMTSDSLKAYKKATKAVFGKKRLLSQTRKGEDTGHSTAYVERHNLTIRMGNRRYARKTNAFSKRFTRHEAMMHVWAIYYNFCWQHGSLRVSPAMEAGVDTRLRDYGWITDLVSAYEDKLPRKKPGPKQGTKRSTQNQ